MSGVESPFFIVGSGRSGTTLLRLVLANHSRISIPPETWFLLHLVPALPETDVLTPAQVDEAVRLMQGYYRWNDLGIDDAEFLPAVRALERPTLRALSEIVFHILMRRDGKVRWGDKTPTYVAIVPQIARIWPEARFIHLVRDGHDVAWSMYSRGWKGSWLVQNAREWIAAIDHMREHRRWLGPDRLLEVRYEDLVLDTEGVARRVCAFLGEEFEPGMLHWEGSIEEQVPEREMWIHQKLFRRPRPSDLHVWRRKMSAGQAFFLEAVMGDRLEGEGYEMRFPGRAWAVPRALARWAMPVALPVVDLAIRVPRALWRRTRRLLSRGTEDAASD